jgi:hypothetical protein
MNRILFIILINLSVSSTVKVVELVEPTYMHPSLDMFKDNSLTVLVNPRNEIRVWDVYKKSWKLNSPILIIIKGT